MKFGFYPKLALSGIKKNSKTYVPYILTCIGSVMMFYIICAMSTEKGLENIYGGATTQAMLITGATVIAIFSVVFLYYTNSFLIKRRKKELGLFNVLGMEKRHIMRIIAFETLFIGFVSIVIGLLGGMLLSKLIMMILLKILNASIVFKMAVSIPSVIWSIAVFGAIFALNLVVNLFRVVINKPIELLQGGNKGEKEPKSNIPLAALGLLTLGGGYYIALTVSDPLTAIAQFFIAVLLVIVGTYCLITAGSTVILKALKKNKGFYYRKNHFISVSGMLYRMKQNAAGISTICILSTMVLVTVSTTFCLYFGLDDLVNSNMKVPCRVTSMSVNDNDVDFVRQTVADAVKAAGADYETFGMTYTSLYLLDSGNWEYNGDSTNMMSADYISLTSPDQIDPSIRDQFKIKKGEAIVFSSGGEEYKTFKLLDKEYTVVSNAGVTNLVNTFYSTVGKNIVVVLSDKDEVQSVMDKTEFNNKRFDYVGAVVGDNPDVVQSIAEYINHAASVSSEHGATKATTIKDTKSEFRSLYGSFLFLGIFLGLLFLMATVLIMYYKQISEGYDDKGRYEILEKVGMSQKEIKGTIRSQVLMIFFIPLILSVIHIAFAFNMIRLIMSMFGLSNIMLFVGYTIGSVLIFAVIYTLVYSVTARTYYKIVR